VGIPRGSGGESGDAVGFDLDRFFLIEKSLHVMSTNKREELEKGLMEESLATMMKKGEDTRA